MANVDEKLLTLLKRLYFRTVNGEVEWESTADPTAFVVSFPRYAVQVSEHTDPYREASAWSLRIYNDDNELMDSISNAQLEREQIEDGTRMLAELYSGARRKAMGVEQAIDSILEELGEEDEIPF